MYLSRLNAPPLESDFYTVGRAPGCPSCQRECRWLLGQINLSCTTQLDLCTIHLHIAKIVSIGVDDRERSPHTQQPLGLPLSSLFVSAFFFSVEENFIWIWVEITTSKFPRLDPVMVERECNNFSKSLFNHISFAFQIKPCSSPVLDRIDY